MGGGETARKENDMKKYYDFTGGRHSTEEHYSLIESLLKDGYEFTHNTFGNPHFTNRHDKSKDDVCILSSISDGSKYFRF